jgi:hypothetical protein
MALNVNLDAAVYNMKNRKAKWENVVGTNITKSPVTNGQTRAELSVGAEQVLFYFLRFKVSFTSVTYKIVFGRNKMIMKNAVSWDMTPCGP